MIAPQSFLKTLDQGFRTIYTSLKSTLPYLFGFSESNKEVTEEYPDRISARMPEDLPVRYRGFLKNDIDKCSGCRICVDVCPIDCIRVETEPGSDKNLSWVAIFDIDMAKCMFCGLCVESCPTGSLVHTRNYEGAVYRLDDLIYSYGRGWATKEIKERWQQDLSAKEAKSEERAIQIQSPVGSELRQMMKERKD